MQKNELSMQNIKKTVKYLFLFSLIVVFLLLFIFKIHKHNIASEDKNRKISEDPVFSFTALDFADNEMFEMINLTYSKIDFSSEFEPGDVKKYKMYKEQYHKLLLQEVKYFNKETGEEYFLEETEYMGSHSDNEPFNPSDYIYYFFDMDEDNLPELCITDKLRFTYIFKYERFYNRIILWYKMNNTWLQLNGSQTVRWDYEGTNHDFYRLNKNGKEVLIVSFFADEYYNKKLGQGEMVYIAALPLYTERNINKGITQEIRNKAYTMNSNDERYYFRITKEQYDILTADYFEATKKAKEDLKKVTFTYEELFEKRVK